MQAKREKLIRALRERTRMLRVEDSLLVLSRALSMVLGEVDDPKAKAALSSVRQPFPKASIHLIAKMILRHGRSNTPVCLEWRLLAEVLPIAIELTLEDPIADNSDEEVGGALVRILSQQAVRHAHLQSYGLAIGLFQDLDATRVPGNFDVRAEVEDALKMPVELFMRLATGVMSSTQAKVNGIGQPGTINLGWLKSAEEAIPSVPWLERWLDFAQAVSCTQEEFNRLDRQHALTETQQAFVAYEFNPLRIKPVVQTAGERYICLDNQQLVQRTSWGIFQDAYEKKRKAFAGPFGHAFQQFVGELLRSVVPKGSLWAEHESGRVRKWRSGKGQHHKLSDYVYQTPSRNVFIECKSARPTLDLITFGNSGQLKSFAVQTAKAIEQLIEHSVAVERNEWLDEALFPRTATMLVVTMGRIETINGIFFRKWIDAELASMKLPVPRYVVLSLEELDSVVWLAECGVDFAEAVETMASEPSFDPLQRYSGILRKHAVSSFSSKKAQRMWDFLPRDV